MADSLLTERQLAALLGIGSRTPEAWRLRGGGPPYIKVGRLVRYRRADVDNWLQDQTRNSTSDAGRTTEEA